MYGESAIAMRQRKSMMLAMLVAVFFLWSLAGFGPVADYVAQVRHPADVTAYSQEAAGKIAAEPDKYDQELLARIRREAEAKRIAPIDARIDRVWKAIPGYNGLEVDVDKTFQLAKGIGLADPIPFVFREVSPAIGLEDLGPQPIYKGNPQKPMVSLMINVAWGDEFLPGMLETLRKESVKATFFFDGTWLSKNIATARTIGEQGHELSNHAYTHPNMSKLGRARTIQEISRTQALLKQKLNVDNGLFAPPSGDFNEQTVAVAHEMKLKTVLWTIDTVDWKNPGADWIVQRISARLEPGAMILMHPTRSSSAALERIIKEVKKRGLVLGTVSELLSPKRVPELETKLR